MSLISLHIEPDKTVAVWKTEEDADFFLRQLPSDVIENLHLEKYAFEQKKLEQLSSRFLLQTIVGEDDIRLLRKTSYGMPYLENSGKKISLSHTKNHSAVIVSEKICGIDIEAVHPRVKKVAHKYLNPSEMLFIDMENETELLTLFWSAKETIYKLYAKRMVDFSEHILLNHIEFTTPESGILHGEFIKEGEQFDTTVFFNFFDGHVMTHAVAEVK